jgi:hypothetical protein
VVIVRYEGFMQDINLASGGMEKMKDHFLVRNTKVLK